MRSRLTLSTAASVWLSLAAAACGGSTTGITEVAAPDVVRCQTTVSPPPSTLPAAGTRLTLSVTAARECSWTAASEASWAQVAPVTGQGEGAIEVTVGANPQARTRTSALVVNDQRLSLSQEAAPCRYDVTPSTARLSHEGGRTAFQISTPDGCAWRVSSNQAWARPAVTSGTSGGTVQVDVSRNDGAARIATLTVADRTVTVEQSAGTTSSPGPNPEPTPGPAPACVLSIDSAERSFGSNGGDGSFRVNAVPGCRWSASTGASWIDLTSADGTGTDTVRYRVESNNGTSGRTGTISVTGHTHTVSQEGAAPVEEKVKLSGRAFLVDGSCPNVTFFVELRRVFTTGDTEFRGKPTCRDLRNGSRVEVDGLLQSDGRVRATRVRIDDDDDD